MSDINAVSSTIELCFCFFCIFCYALIRFTIDEENRERRSLVHLNRAFFINGICLLMDGTIFFFRNIVFHQEWIAIRINTFLAFVLPLFLFREEAMMLESELKESGKNISSWYHWLIHIFCVINLAGLVITQFYPLYYVIDAQNHYERSTGMYFYNFSGLCIFLSILLFLIIYRESLELRDFCLYLLLICMLILSACLQIRFKGLSVVNIINALGLVMFFFHFEEKMTRRLVRQERKQAEIESELLKARLELSETNTRIMLSQISPHFIFNALTCIRSLISQDPEEARKAVGYFARYLRNNMQFLEQKELTDIDQEIRFMQNYIYMEKLRFGDSLNVVLEKENISFLLPPLTLQPLVDNAIRHGIRRKESGEGTVRIRIFQDERDHIIEVEDDGVGFSREEEKEKGQDHTGLRNIRSRLAIMCQGSLQIESQEGKYSLVTVRIPKKEKEHDPS